MKPAILPKLMLGLSLAAMTTAAHATDDAFEVWLNPSIEYDLSNHDSIELETAQRLRSESDGRVDTYFVRAWLHHDVNDNLSLSLTYLRQQDFHDNAPDRVGHAPLIGVSYTS